MRIRILVSLWLAGLLSSCSASAQTVLSNQYYEVATLAGQTVTMSGRSELHLKGGGTPITGCTINMNSVDSWVFLDAVLAGIKKKYRGFINRCF